MWWLRNVNFVIYFLICCLIFLIANRGDYNELNTERVQFEGNLLSIFLFMLWGLCGLQDESAIDSQFSDFQRSVLFEFVISANQAIASNAFYFQTTRVLKQQEVSESLENYDL